MNKINRLATCLKIYLGIDKIIIKPLVLIKKKRKLEKKRIIFIQVLNSQYFTFS